MKKLLILSSLLSFQINAKILGSRFMLIIPGICIKQGKVNPERPYETKLKMYVEGNKAGSVTFIINSGERKVPNFQRCGFSSVEDYHYLNQQPQFIIIKRSDASIEKIKITPLFQKRGLGSILLSFALEHIEKQNINEITTTAVDSNNIAALKLFENAGFTIDRVEITANESGTKESYILKKK